MKFTFDGNDYDIRFKYRFIRSVCNTKGVRSTQCIISRIDNTIPCGKERYRCVAVGHTTQHVNDPDVKSTARKIALGRAIMVFLDRSDYRDKKVARKRISRRIWDSYFKACPLHKIAYGPAFC